MGVEEGLDPDELDLVEMDVGDQNGTRDVGNSQNEGECGRSFSSGPAYVKLCRDPITGNGEDHAEAVVRVQGVPSEVEIEKSTWLKLRRRQNRYIMTIL